MTQINNMNKKRTYEKPSMVIYKLQNRQQLLTGSVPIANNPSRYQW